MQREQRVDQLDQADAQPVLVEPARVDVAARAPAPAHAPWPDPVDERDALDQLHREEPVAAVGWGPFDGVVHLAARAERGPASRSRSSTRTSTASARCASSRRPATTAPRNFVFGSSSSVYGINPKVPFSEEDRIDLPISPYATTKRTGELLCFNYSHLYGLRTSCLRFFTVYGPSQRPEMAIHRLTDLLARGQQVPMYGDGETRRDYTYVDDIVAGIVAAYDPAPAFEIFNLGGAETTRLSELVRWLAEELAVELRIEYLPDQPGDVPITYADVAKAIRN